jgi:histidinol phosphatase-like enzyme (inositol monophosphatase family)
VPGFFFALAVPCCGWADIAVRIKDMSASRNGSQAEEFLAFAGELADAAAAVTLKHFRTGLAVDNKHAHLFDPVTQADRDAESAMRALIAARYPDHGIVGEEHGRTATKNGLSWILDPVDGTRSFIAGNPLWGTLIALSGESGPIVGVLDQPFMGERFFGLRGAGARAGYLRGGEAKPLKTRPCAHLADAILSTTTPDMFEAPGERAGFEGLKARARLTRFGGDCYQYALVAMGCMDLVVEAGLQPYDIQALIPIIESAGGVVTNWAGEPAYSGGCIVAAGDPGLHEEALEVLQLAVT